MKLTEELKKKIEEGINNIPKERLEEILKPDTTPKGWVSIEEHLPMWKAVDLMEGGSTYKVKTADGREGYTTVSDHNVWYHLAKDAGITHWWND